MVNPIRYPYPQPDEGYENASVKLDTRREYLNLLLDMQNACGDLAALAGLELQ